MCSSDLHKVCILPFRKVKKGSLLIDSSTIDPMVSKEMAVAAEKMGAVFMDAPVSGGKDWSGFRLGSVIYKDPMWTLNSQIITYFTTNLVKMAQAHLLKLFYT